MSCEDGICVPEGQEKCMYGNCVQFLILVCGTSSPGNTHLCEKIKKFWAKHEYTPPLSIIEPEVKAQGHTEAILVRDTSSNGNAPTCQIS